MRLSRGKPGLGQKKRGLVDRLIARHTHGLDFAPMSVPTC